MLIEIYVEQDFLRESIQAILLKILSFVTDSTKIFDNIFKKLIVDLEIGEEGQAKTKAQDLKNDQIVEKILQSSQNLSLFLTLRKVYVQDNLDGNSDFKKVLEVDLLSQKKYLVRIIRLLKK